MLKFSIILPIYNVENFLSDCLDSLYEQEIPEEEYEVICVVDGSPDDSMAIVERYIKKHSNIRLFVQENRGVCAARNTGLKNASGRYVWFVDPDDMIVSNCLKVIFEELEKAQADVFEMQYRTCAETYKFVPQVVNFQIDRINKEGSSGSAWLSVCRRQYLLENNILFNEKLSYGEDYLWAFQVKYSKHKNIYTKTPLYVYRQRENSAMHANNPVKTRKHMEDMIELYHIYGEEAQRCRVAGMDESVLQNISQRQQLCIESALLCLLKLRLSKTDVKQQLNKLQMMGLYPYKFMTWNLFGKGTVNPLKVRTITFLFPIRCYYLLLCSLYRMIQR